MDKRVLGANYTTVTPPNVTFQREPILPRGLGTPDREMESVEDDQWVIIHGQSCDWSPHGNPNGSAIAPLQRSLAADVRRLEARLDCGRSFRAALSRGRRRRAASTNSQVA